MIQRVLLLFVILSCLPLAAQKPIDYEKMKSFNVVVNYPDYTVKTQMLKEGKKVSANESLTYHWYASNKIMSTKGGFDGKLLHGYYKCFYLNNNLKESGSFKYGLKKGEWRYWFEDGKLREIIHWKNGQKNGVYKLFNSSGELIGKGNFKADVLHGKFKTYSKGHLTETLTYKNGEVVPVKQKVKKAKAVKSRDNVDTTTSSKEKRSFKERWNGLFHKNNEKVQKKSNAPNDNNGSLPSNVKKKKKGKAKKEKNKKVESSTPPQN